MTKKQAPDPRTYDDVPFDPSKDPSTMTQTEFGALARWMCWAITTTPGGWDKDERAAFLHFLETTMWIIPCDTDERLLGESAEE